MGAGFTNHNRMLSLTLVMEVPSMHGWQAVLVLKTNDKMYDRIPWKFLPSAEVPDLHGWKISMDEMQHLRCKLLHPLSPCIYQELSHCVPDLSVTWTEEYSAIEIWSRLKPLWLLWSE